MTPMSDSLELEVNRLAAAVADVVRTATGRSVSRPRILAALAAQYLATPRDKTAAFGLLRHDPANRLVELWFATWGCRRRLTSDIAADLGTLSAFHNVASPPIRELRQWIADNGLPIISPVGLGRFLSKFRGTRARVGAELFQLTCRQVAGGMEWSTELVP